MGANKKAYEGTRRLLLEQLTSNKDRIKCGTEEAQIRRKLQRKKEYKLKINCPQWVVAVLYDDLKLYQQIEKKKGYLFSWDTRRMFVMERYVEDEVFGDYLYEVYGYDMVWYCASKNEHVTEEVLMQSLGRWEKRFETGGYHVCESAVNEFFGHDTMDWESTRDRAKKIYEYAPEQIRSMFLTKKRTIDKWKRDLFFGNAETLGELFLLQMIMRDKDRFIKNDSQMVILFQKFLCYLISLHCTAGRFQFSDVEHRIASAEYFMKRLWRERELLGKRFLEVLLWGWDQLTSLKAERNSMIFEFDSKDMYDSEIEKAEKKLDQMFRQLIADYCKEHPEDIGEIFKRTRFFPSVEQILFLSKQVLHKHIVVPEKYLEERHWRLCRSHWFMDEREEDFEEDLLLIRCIKVKKKKREDLSTLEQDMIRCSPDDVLWAAAKAELFTLERMPLYLEYSRRYGEMKAIPTLIGIQQFQKGVCHAE